LRGIHGGWFTAIPRLSYELPMLPLLRVMLLGCVLIATLGLAAGFKIAAAPEPNFARLDRPARGALLDPDQHPEWKQFVVQAAYRRAEELDRLRVLHDRPAVMPPVATAPAPSPNDDIQTAGLPTTDAEVRPDENDDVTGSVTERAINDVIPIEIGETSSTELPVGPPPATVVPEQPKRLQLPDESSAAPDATTDTTAAVETKAAVETTAAVEAKSEVETKAAAETKTVAAMPVVLPPAKPRPASSHRKANAKSAAVQKPAPAADQNPLAALLSAFEPKDSPAPQ
jgi:hypothetical protein